MSYAVLKINRFLPDLSAGRESFFSQAKKFTTHFFTASRHIPLLVFGSVFILGVIYVVEVHSVINYGQKLVSLNRGIKVLESELAKNEVDYLQISSFLISEDFKNAASSFEKVSKIEYIEKKSFVEAPKYIP